MYRILVINPGSTSTKVSLFEDETSRFEHSLFHDAPELLKFPHVNDQLDFRRGVILDMLRDEGVDPASIDAFVGRGGSAHTQPGGITRAHDHGGPINEHCNAEKQADEKIENLFHFVIPPIISV